VNRLWVPIIVYRQFSELCKIGASSLRTVDLWDSVGKPGRGWGGAEVRRSGLRVAGDSSWLLTARHSHYINRRRPFECNLRPFPLTLQHRYGWARAVNAGTRDARSVSAKR